MSVGAKGCVTFSTKPVRDYREFLEIDDRYNHAHWLFQHNGGVFLPPWGKTEQWLISVQHDEEDVDRFLAQLRALREGGAELVDTPVSPPGIVCCRHRVVVAAGELADAGGEHGRIRDLEPPSSVWTVT